MTSSAEKSAGSAATRVASASGTPSAVNRAIAVANASSACSEVASRRGISSTSSGTAGPKCPTVLRMSSG
jgi:hypothetical protein